MKTTGELLKEYRKLRGYTLEKFSNEVSRSISYVSDLEKERRNFPKKELGDKIIEVLRISLEDQEAIKKYEDYKKTPESVKNELDGLKKTIEKITNSEFRKVTIEGKEGIPVFGDISAGNGKIIYGDVIDYYPLSDGTKNTDDLVAVRVSGDSMEPQILNGSQVLIRTGIELENGQLGAFCIGEECFVKQFKKYGDHIVLKSIKNSYDDIELAPGDDFHLIGRVIEGRNKF